MADKALTQQDFQFYNQQHAPAGYVDWGKDALIQWQQYMANQGSFADQTDAQVRDRLGLTNATPQQKAAFTQAASTQGSDLARSQMKSSDGLLGLGPLGDAIVLGGLGIATGGFGLAGLMGAGAESASALEALDLGMAGGGAGGASYGAGITALDAGAGATTLSPALAPTQAGMDAFSSSLPADVGTSAVPGSAVTATDYAIPPELQGVPNNPLQTGAEPGLGQAAANWIKANPLQAASLGLTAAGLVQKFGQSSLPSGTGAGQQPATIRPFGYAQARNPAWQPLQQGQIYRGGVPFQNQSFIPGDSFAVAQGGMIPGNGIASLGGYSDGGRMVKGPGTGLSDDIPARINGQQEARLADGEFVVPADVVSALGGGSTESGSKKLYAMLDRVRSQAHGSKQQIRKVPDRVLPK